MKLSDYYEQQGAGSPLVFIHGSFASSATWKRFVQTLSASHHCISIKLPGHGGAADLSPLTKHSIHEEAALVHRIINQLTDQPVHLIGHSYGAVLALAIALEGDVALAQLSLFEPVAVWLLQQQPQTQTEYATVQQFLATYQQAIAQHEPHACGRLIDFWVGENSYAKLPIAIQNAMQGLTPYNSMHWQACMALAYSLEDLKQLNTPTKIICGSLSNPILHSIAYLLKQQLPNSQQQEIAAASHFLVTSHSEACLAALNQSSAA